MRATGVAASHRGRQVVRDLSWSIENGQLYAVLGPNGAGKSTFLRACLGLHPLDAGSVEWDGRPLESHGRRALSRLCAYVPQHTEGGEDFTGLELVLMGRAPHRGLWGLTGHDEEALARSWMERLGVGHLISRRTQEVSGGERRLLWMARALTQTPRALLLDEPTAFLDLRHQVEALRVLRACAREDGLAVVAVLHDVNLAAAFADQVLLLRDGRSLAQGPATSLLTAARLGELYGVPMGEARVGDQPVFTPR